MNGPFEVCDRTDDSMVVKFPSKEAARDWYASPEYRAIVGLRTDNSGGLLVLADEFAMP